MAISKQSAKNNHFISPSQCFKGKRILITGTTGFVGKVVLEKLLREHPDIGGIALLIRGNSAHPDARSRFEAEILTSSIFDTLRMDDEADLPSLCAQKLHFVSGEVTQPCFGLGQDEFDSLALTLDGIINCAASVNFREELDVALEINALCLHTLASLARQAGNIPVLQVSTCYVGGFNHGDLYEQNVTPAGKPLPKTGEFFEVAGLITQLQGKIQRLKKRYQGETLKRKLIDLGIAEANRYGWNDTYTFTKWMGEQILRDELAQSALTILRPSIIESTLSGPVPGWIEGVKVADAIILAYAREKVRFFPGNPNAVIDIIPADIVANSIILGLAEQFDDAVRHMAASHRVYQCCSGSSNPVKLGEVAAFVAHAGAENYARFDRLFYRKPRRAFVTVPKAIFDGVMKGASIPLGVISRLQTWAGLKMAAKTIENIETTLNLATIFSFYTSPNYIFHNKQLVDLGRRVCDDDAAKYPVDVKMIDWKAYFEEIHLNGLNRYALKERRLYRLKVNEDISAKKRKVA